MMRNFFLNKEVRPNVKPKNFKNFSYRRRIHRLAVVLAGQGFGAHGLFFSRAISSSTLREHPLRIPPLSPTRWLRRCKVRVGRSCVSQLSSHLPLRSLVDVHALPPPALGSDGIALPVIRGARVVGCVGREPDELVRFLKKGGLV